MEGDEDEVMRNLRRLSQPNFFTNFMVKRSCLCIIISFAFLFGVAGFTFFMGWLFPNDPHDRDYLVWGDEYVNNFDKSRLATESLLISDSQEAVPLQS